jgi:hypothetical protein
MYQKMTEEEATERLFSRFWNNALIGDGCWEWIGSKTKKGYGRISVMREGAWKVEVASRVAWFLSTGEWPILHVLHTCDNPACVRHSHHFQGTHQDNMKDCKEKGRTNGGHRNQTLCKRGHSMADAYPNGPNKRRCRICRDAWKKAHPESFL